MGYDRLSLFSIAFWNHESCCELSLGSVSIEEDRSEGVMCADEKGSKSRRYGQYVVVWDAEAQSLSSYAFSPYAACTRVPSSVPQYHRSQHSYPTKMDI